MKIGDKDMGIVEKYKNDILYYQIEGFSSDKKMNHVFSTRIGWQQDRLFNNLSEILDIPDENIYRVKQVHGIDVLIIDDQNNMEINMLERDGLITNKKGMAICTYHADCVPIYFYDSAKEVIALAHAGWKGTLRNINRVIIENMIEKFNCNIEDISVAIGPSIGSCCYEIGHDVEKLFKDEYPNYSDIIIYKNNKIHLNLWKVNKINLLKLGIKDENIYESNFCTSCNIDKLYSYRKEKGTKNRMIAAISLNS